MPESMLCGLLAGRRPPTLLALRRLSAATGITLEKLAAEPAKGAANGAN
jgi:hypothetical protein